MKGVGEGVMGAVDRDRKRKGEQQRRWEAEGGAINKSGLVYQSVLMGINL